MGVSLARRIAVGCGALVACAAFVPALAGAATNHVAGAEFDRTSTVDGYATSVSVDETTGQVYLLSSRLGGNGVLERFDSEGNPSSFEATGTNRTELGCSSENWGCFQLTVDNSDGPNEGIVYVGESLPFNPEGLHAVLPSGELLPNIKAQSEISETSPCGVAVAPDGHLIISHGQWVGNVSETFIDELELPNLRAEPTKKGKALGELGPNFPYACRTALDSDGSIYSLQAFGFESTGPVFRVDPSTFGKPNIAGGGVPESLMRTGTELDPGPDSDLAIDAEDNLYVVRTGSNARVLKIDPEGSIVDEFGAGELEEPSGIAIDRKTGVIYVTDKGSGAGAKDVHIFNPVTVADSLTGRFTAATSTSGEISGSVDPEIAGPVIGCGFEYVEVSKFESTAFAEANQVFCEQLPPIGSDQAVSAPVSGLTPEVPYVFRLRSSDGNGTSNGTVRRFIPHQVVGLSTDAATGIGPHSATLNASFVGNGSDVEYLFEYGKTKAYGSTTAAEVAAGSGPKSVSTGVSGLELETTYHYRVTAVRGAEASVAEDGTFTTPPAIAGVVTKPATDIGQGAITLNGEFVGSGTDTSYYFQYGTTQSYGQVSDSPPGVDAGTTTGPTPVSSEIETYTGHSTYHYRLVAVNEFGTSFGPDRELTSEDPPLPEVRGALASGIGPTSATLSGEVNPNRWATTYLFEYGHDTGYGQADKLDGTVIGGEDTVFQSVSSQITGLEPGTLYHYRIVATNLTGTSTGPDLTFTTPGPPAVPSGGVSTVTQTSAHLAASVLPNGSPTSVRFEYGTSTGYGATSASISIGDGTSPQAAAADLAGLQPGTTYHARAVAANGIGTTDGEDLTFTTAPAPSTQPKEQEPAAKKCAKGKVKRKGKCVKKPHKKKHKNKNGKGKKHGA